MEMSECLRVVRDAAYLRLRYRPLGAATFGPLLPGSSCPEHIFPIRPFQKSHPSWQAACSSLFDRSANFFYYIPVFESGEQEAL